MSVVVDRDLARRIAFAERGVRDLNSQPGSAALESIARLLLRSEAIASSLIEGIAPSPQQVALAELSATEPIKGFGAKALLVANNIAILGRASEDLVRTDAVAVDDIEALHAALLTDERHHGLRRVQNWIGGSNWHPLAADYVPPTPDLVRPLMDDLVEYLNGSVHGPVVQAALVHAQFETIHPFTDGNGRVGRALIHTVLARRGLTSKALLPVSMVLATLSDRYVSGLTSFRHSGASADEPPRMAIAEWIETFVHAVEVATDIARTLATDIVDVQAHWAGLVARHRQAAGLRGEPRAGSATSRIMMLLPEIPVLTTRTVQRVLEVSFPSARSALEELADAGVLDRKSVDRGTTGYLARGILDLVATTERQLASTKFDTRSSPPGRRAPAAPA